jgi:acetyl esterase
VFKAPEHPFPAGLNDSYAAVTWAAANLPTLKGTAGFLAVGGDSAGGNLAAGVTLLARDRPVGAASRRIVVHVVQETPLPLASSVDRECPGGP